MVGRDNIPDIRISNNNGRNDVTYSMQKEKKKANIQMTERHTENIEVDSGDYMGLAVDNDVASGDYMGLVDTFVQEVIAKAKIEYLGGCANGNIEIQDLERIETDRLNTGNLKKGYTCWMVQWPFVSVFLNSFLLLLCCCYI